MLSNPIILKECLQSSRRIRTYAMRAGLPLIAMMLLVPTLSYSLRYGQDWRTVSRLARTVFETTSWFMIFAFPLLAFGMCSVTLREEWSNRTMEVLCASPLTRIQVVYGKFIAALSRLTMCALALLPVMGLWFHMGRIPRDVVLGTFAVIFTSMVMMGSVALLQSAMYRPGKSGFWSTLLLIGPYFLIWVMLKILVLRHHPLPDAAIPLFALSRALDGNGFGNMSAGQFMALSAGLNLSVAGVALALTPWVFGRSFTRYLTGGKKRSRLRAFRRWLGGGRPSLTEAPRLEWLGVATVALVAVVGFGIFAIFHIFDYEEYTPEIAIIEGVAAVGLFLPALLYRRREVNPFAWQERGGPTTVERWALWLIYGVTIALVLAFSYADDPSDTFEAFDEWGFYVFLFVEGLAVIGIVSLFYGTCVFAREKGRRRSSALLLTGHGGGHFYWSKMAALYYALRYSLLAVAFLVLMIAFLGGFQYFSTRDMIIFIVLTGQGLLFGPALCCVVGMAFSLVSRNPMRACLGLLGAVGWGFLIGWGLIMFGEITHGLDDGSSLVAIIFLVSSYILRHLIRRWRAWKMALILALDFFSVIMLLVACDEIFSGRSEETAMLVVGCGAAWLLCLGWMRLGLRIFDRGMAGEMQ